MVTLDGTELMSMFQKIMEAQSDQAAQFRATLIDALRTREAAPPAPSAPLPKPGTAREYKNLQPMDFCGTEGILYADEWLENAERLLKIARIPEDL